MKLVKLLPPLFFIIISTINGESSAFDGLDNSGMNFLRQNSPRYSTSKRDAGTKPTGGQSLADYERQMISKDQSRTNGKETTTKRNQPAKDKPQQRRREKFENVKQKEEQDRAERERHQQIERDRQRQVEEQERHRQLEQERHRQAERERHEQKKREKEEKAERARESRERMFNSTMNTFSTVFASTGIASDVVNMVRPTISRGIGTKINEKLNGVFGSPQQWQQQNATAASTLGGEKNVTAEMMANEQTMTPVTIEDNVTSNGTDVESESATVTDTTNSEQAEIVVGQIATESNEETGGQIEQTVSNTESGATTQTADNNEAITEEMVSNTESDATSQNANNNGSITEGASADNDNAEKLETEGNHGDGEKYVESETNEESIPKLEEDSVQTEASIQN